MTQKILHQRALAPCRCALAVILVRGRFVGITGVIDFLQRLAHLLQLYHVHRKLNRAYCERRSLQKKTRAPEGSQTLASCCDLLMRYVLVIALSQLACASPTSHAPTWRPPSASARRGPRRCRSSGTPACDTSPAGSDGAPPSRLRPLLPAANRARHAT